MFRARSLDMNKTALIKTASTWRGWQNWEVRRAGTIVAVVSKLERPGALYRVAIGVTGRETVVELSSLVAVRALVGAL